MAGVCLVGYSGSLIKNTIKDSAIVSALIQRFVELPNDVPPLEAIETPEPTTVLVGQSILNIVGAMNSFIPFAGVFFILFAQILCVLFIVLVALPNGVMDSLIVSTATQFVVEEKIMARYSVEPLVAVGYEGLFGVLSVLLFFPILSIPSVAARTPFFDLPRGWHQMVDNPPVLYTGIIIAISISLFNYFGLSVTRHVSATARSLTDTCRTLSIWIVSLGLGWEKLLWPISLLQVLGFTLLV
jgi:hypothetical protein